MSTTTVLKYAAFTTLEGGGNPAGVVLDATGLSDARMLSIAADVGYSETAFLFPRGENEFDIRYFSPESEVAFCGHATIATGVALGFKHGPAAYVLHSQAGELSLEVSAEGAGYVAALMSPPASSRTTDPSNVDRLLELLRWNAKELDDRFPVRIANSGNDHPIVVAATRERLSDLNYDFDGLKELMLEQGWTTIQLLHATDDSAKLWSSRNPFPVGGVYEDPATGAAAAAFGGYLRDLGSCVVGDVVLIHQGDDMGAPSLIKLEIGVERMKINGAGARI
jgi:PhzF family phenazine biosynthesis protein